MQLIIDASGVSTPIDEVDPMPQGDRFYWGPLLFQTTPGRQSVRFEFFDARNFEWRPLWPGDPLAEAVQAAIELELAQTRYDALAGSETR
jgi:hypothetical protein